MATKQKWRTISLPSELLDQVKKFTKSVPEYTSISDFVTKATAEKLKQEMINKN